MTTPAARTAWRDRRTTPLTFTLDGRQYPVPAHPSRVWVLALLSEDPADLLLDALPEATAAELWDDAADPDCPVTTDLLHDIGRALLARETGRPWWQVTQLVATLVSDWASYDAQATDRGLGDPLDWPLERLCNWVHYQLVRDVDESERARIDATLATPTGAADPAAAHPTGDPAEEEWSAGGGWAEMAAEFGVADEHGMGRATST